MEEVIEETTICDANGNCREVFSDTYESQRKKLPKNSTETVVDEVDCKDGVCQEKITDTVSSPRQTTVIERILSPFRADRY